MHRAVTIITGKRGGQKDSACRNVESPLDTGSKKALIESAAKNQPAWVKGIHSNLPSFALKKSGRVGHLDAVQLAFQQVLNRKTASPTFLNCDNDFARPVLISQRYQ